MTSSLALALSSMLFGTIFGQGACENLASLSLPNTTITAAGIVPAGPYTPGGGVPGRERPGPLLPEHCRVAAVLSPSPDSHIEMELWMPTGEDWNGKFLAVGNGGWAGSISFGAIAGGLAEGYATASNDHRPQGRRRRVRAPRGKARGLRISGNARDDRAVEDHPRALLQPSAAPVLLRGMLDGRPSSSDGRRAVPGRL